MARRDCFLKLALGLMVPLAMLAMVAGKAFAEEGGEPAKKATVTGKVAVEKNDNGAVTAVKVGDQKLVLDDKAKELAGKLADKQAEVTGTVDKDGALKLESYKAVEEQKPDPAE